MTLNQGQVPELVSHRCVGVNIRGPSSHYQGISPTQEFTGYSQLILAEGFLKEEFMPCGKYRFDGFVILYNACELGDFSPGHAGAQLQL